MSLSARKRKSIWKLQHSCLFLPGLYLPHLHLFTYPFTHLSWARYCRQLQWMYGISKCSLIFRYAGFTWSDWDKSVKRELWLIYTQWCHTGNIVCKGVNECIKPTCMSVSGRVIIRLWGLRGFYFTHSLYQLISLISCFSLAEGEIRFHVWLKRKLSDSQSYSSDLTPYWKTLDLLYNFYPL